MSIVAAFDNELPDIEFPPETYSQNILVELALGRYNGVEHTREQIIGQKKTFVNICKNVIFTHCNTLDISYYIHLPDIDMLSDMFKEKGVDTSNIKYFRAHYNNGFTFDHLRIIVQNLKNIEMLDIYGCDKITNSADGSGINNPLLYEIDNILVPMVNLNCFTLQHRVHSRNNNICHKFMQRINNGIMFMGGKKGSKITSIAIDLWRLNYNNRKKIIPYRLGVTDYTNITRLSIRNVLTGRRELERTITTFMFKLTYLDLSIPQMAYYDNIDTSTTSTNCRLLLDTKMLPKLDKLCINGCTLSEDIHLLSNDEFKRLELFGLHVEYVYNNLQSILPILDKYLESHGLTLFGYIEKYVTRYWTEVKYLAYGFVLPFIRYSYGYGLQGTHDYNEWGTSNSISVESIEDEIEMYDNLHVLPNIQDEIKQEEDFRGPNKYNRQFRRLFDLYYSFITNPKCSVLESQHRMKLYKNVYDLATTSFRYRGMDELINLISELASMAEKDNTFRRERWKNIYILMNNIFRELLNTRISVKDTTSGIVQIFKQHYVHRQRIDKYKVCRLIIDYASIIMANAILHKHIQVLDVIIKFFIKLLLVDIVDTNFSIGNKLKNELSRLIETLKNVDNYNNENDPDFNIYYSRAYQTEYVCLVNMLIYSVDLYVPLRHYTWKSEEFLKIYGHCYLRGSHTGTEFYTDWINMYGDIVQNRLVSTHSTHNILLKIIKMICQKQTLHF